jgi:hypothetical protein
LLFQLITIHKGVNVKISLLSRILGPSSSLDQVSNKSFKFEVMHS